MTSSESKLLKDKVSASILFYSLHACGGGLSNNVSVVVGYFTFSGHRNTDNFRHRRSTVKHCIFPKSCSFCVGDFIFAIKTLFLVHREHFLKVAGLICEY